MLISATFQTAARLLFLALLCATVSVHADEAQDVNQLISAGKLSEATAKADAFLAFKPNDPQMRFLKGVLQRSTGKQSEAIATFIKLTEDYPSLSEPYNNLAVIYAGQNQFDKARVALEMAIRTNPSYATAYENLGDVYLRLAGLTYSKALELDIGNTVIPGKLSLLREANKFNPKAPAQTAPKSVVAAATLPAKADPMSAAAKPAPLSGVNKPDAEVEKAVLNWAKAWSSQDMATYLAAYGKEFNPPGAQSFAAWAQERKTRILKKTGISIGVEALSVNITGNRAIANFRQSYRSGALNETTQKSLELVKVGEQWLIVKETSVK